MSVRLARRLASDTAGVTIVEFAMAAPVLLLAVLGLFDLGHNMYTASVIHGVVQKAARDSTIEGAADKADALDQRVTGAVQLIAPGATLQFNRASYATFSEVRKPEDFTDLNDNGACDANEPFEDANGNGTWDADAGKEGFGGARDAVLYRVTVTYDRPFPVSRLIGQPGTFTTTARTVLRNQPYGPQTSVKKTENCP
jgi:hypothetical protein